MIRALGSVVALAVLISCESGERPGTARAEAETDPTAEVIAASMVIVGAFGRDDPDAYFELFDPEASFIFHTTPHRLESREAYRREWASWRKDLAFKVRSCTSSEPRVQMFGDIAILTHLVRTEITTTEGDSTLHERETIVFHRRGGQWIAVHEHLSPRPKSPGEA